MSEPQWKVVCGDALEVLKTLPDHSFDAMCTDPPAGVSFMQGYQSWDSFKGGGKSERDNFVAAMAAIFSECRRVLKPGAHAFVWALPRTSHWTAWALEEAGLEVRDQIVHLFGQGMPKSQDAAKAIDKMLGQKGKHGAPKSEAHAAQLGRGGRNPGVALVKKPWMDDPEQFDNLQREYIPGSVEAEQWLGWATALKPAHENWLLARTPIVEKSITRNLLEHGAGYLNIDVCRVDRAKDDIPGWHKSGAKGSDGYLESDTFKIRDMSPEEIQARCGDKGRWPPNVLLSDDAITVVDEQSGIGRSRKGKPRRSQQPGQGWGMTAVGTEYDDMGGASRFFPCFYTPKPGRSEKEAGLEELPERTLNRVNPGGLEHEPRFAPVQVKNHHSTVKGISLCRWLSKLICPVAGYILDPFSGSGSIGAAAVLEGLGYFGIDREPDYVEIARARIAHWAKQREDR